jgi:hypothetical protein
MHKASRAPSTVQRFQNFNQWDKMSRGPSMTTQPRFIRAQLWAHGGRPDMQSRRQPHSWDHSSANQPMCRRRSSRTRQCSRSSNGSCSYEATSRHVSNNSWAALRSGQQHIVASLASSPVSSRKQPPQIGDCCSHARWQDAVLSSAVCAMLHNAEQITVSAAGFGCAEQSFVHIQVTPCCRVLDTALHDLQALMAQAQAMVDLAEQFRLQLARQPPEPGSQEVYHSIHLPQFDGPISGSVEAYAWLCSAEGSISPCGTQLFVRHQYRSWRSI